jgi:hypothetical protein
LPAWGTNQVFTQPYTSTETIVWSIPSCNVIITLPKQLIGSDSIDLSAVFTFTTESQQAFPAPLKSIAYFFSLDGSTPQVLPSSLNPSAAGPQDFSFNADMAPTIEWTYQGADLGKIQESSLRLYREWGLFGDQDWKVQKGFVDTKNKKAHFELEQLDFFGFGGYTAQSFLPLITNAATGE